ncbi:MAG TPA: hypothetical protein VGK21_08490 [Candidatus Angelobacter sp.]|jgi:hypothetical protein
MGEALPSVPSGIIRATASFREVKIKIALTQRRRANVLVTNMTITFLSVLLALQLNDQ